MTTAIPQTDWVYDIETYLDLFCIDLTHISTRHRYIYEISDRTNDAHALESHLRRLGAAGQYRNPYGSGQLFHPYARIRRRSYDGRVWKHRLLRAYLDGYRQCWQYGDASSDHYYCGQYPTYFH